MTPINYINNNATARKNTAHLHIHFPYYFNKSQND